jgi:hypothetical protein
LLTFSPEFFSFRLQSKNLKQKIHRPARIILPVLYGWNARSVTLQDYKRLTVLENKATGKTFRLKGQNKDKARENYIIKKYVICTLHQILSVSSHPGTGHAVSIGEKIFAKWY